MSGTVAELEARLEESVGLGGGEGEEEEKGGEEEEEEEGEEEGAGEEGAAPAAGPEPALNPNEIVTAIVCDGCDGDFELPPGVPVPDGEWYCAACCVGERAGAPKPVQAVAEGLQLHLSSSSRTGYTGVSLHRASRRFHAFRREGCKSVYIGTYCTAVEAAVAYARAAEQAFAEPAELPSSSVDSPRAAEQVRAGFAEAPSVAASVAQEARGAAPAPLEHQQHRLHGRVQGALWPLYG